MSALRSLVFLLLTTVLTVVFGLVLPAAIVLPLAWRFRLLALWRVPFMTCVRWVLGIRYTVEGRENIPDQPSVILCKHQSAWETVGLQAIFPPVVFVLKRELLWIPFFGWGLAALRMISINRTSIKEALTQVARQGRERLEQGLWVAVFPEGTRVAPGERGQYKAGGALLASRAGALVVPVAHNAGEVWPKNAFVKHPGTVRVSIGPAIETRGLKTDEVMRRVESWIEGEMQRFAEEAGRPPQGS